MTDQDINYTRVSLPLREAMNAIVAALATFTLSVPNLPREALELLAQDMENDLDNNELDEAFKRYMRATVEYLRTHKSNETTMLH